MKKFIYHIFSLFAALIALNFLIYLLLSYRVDSRFNNYYSILGKIKNVQYDILITGDSHANDCWNGIDNEEVLDLSFPGDNYLDIKRKLIYLENQGVRYNQHIIEVDRHMLTDYRNSTNNNDLSIYFTDNKYFVEIQRFFPLFFNSNLTVELKASFASKHKPSDELSSEGGISQESMSKRASDQFWNSEFNSNMCSNFEELITRSQQNGAEVIFLTYPLFVEYKTIIDTSQSFIAATDYIHKLEDGMKIRHISSENLFCDRKWFFNQDHLNKQGATIAQEYYIKLFYDTTISETETCIDADSVNRDNE